MEFDHFGLSVGYALFLAVLFEASLCGDKIWSDCEMGASLHQLFFIFFQRKAKIEKALSFNFIMS